MPYQKLLLSDGRTEIDDWLENFKVEPIPGKGPGAIEPLVQLEATSRELQTEATLAIKTDMHAAIDLAEKILVYARQNGSPPTVIHHDLENLAKRLSMFIGAVWQQAGGSGFQTQVGLPLQSQTPGKLYERCLGELTDHECTAFDRMIEKMLLSPALASPPGAIVPP